jgi:tetratricopeptide (TPR) repeat protein
VKRRAFAGLAAMALLLGACQSPPAPPPKAADAATLAAQALERGEYEKAAGLYRRALQSQPESLPLHYGLAVAASFLNLKEEAIREFKWVLEHGASGTVEVEAARRWLISVGALPRPAVTAARESDQKPGAAVLEGRAVFAEAGKEAKPMKRLQLFLVGQPNSPTKEERYNLRTDEQGHFKFSNVMAGPYKLTNRVAGQPIWRLRVELKASQDTFLELNPANSVSARDDFPEQR